MRTDAELLKFALTCEKIEKQGGDVLGYIEQEYPSYTPRATWYRLQKNQLKRTTEQLTEGKPKEKGVKYVGKMMDLAQGCIEAYSRGESVYDFLASQGIKNPSAYWCQIKATVKLKDPDLYEKLSVIRTDTRKKETPARKEAESIFFGGKEYEKMEGPSPTCCQPARQGGPIKWDNEAMIDGPEEISMRKLSIKEEPITIKELKLRTLQGEMGTYEKLADDRMLFTGSPRPFTDCGYTVAEWFVLIEELQIAIKQLGLK